MSVQMTLSDLGSTFWRFCINYAPMACPRMTKIGIVRQVEEKRVCKGVRPSVSNFFQPLPTTKRLTYTAEFGMVTHVG